jgi:hypothetical protein
VVVIGFLGLVFRKGERSLGAAAAEEEAAPGGDDGGGGFDSEGVSLSPEAGEENKPKNDGVTRDLYRRTKERERERGRERWR